MGQKKAETARNNGSKSMWENLISPKNILNETLLFDTSKTAEEVIMDKIIKSVNDPLNDEYYIEHPHGTNTFTFRREDGK